MKMKQDILKGKDDSPRGGGGLPEGGEPYQQLVTDGEGKTVWEDRLAYESELLAVNSHLDAMMYRVADVPATLPAEGDSVTIWLKYGENTMSRDEVVSAEKEDGTFEEDGYISIMQNSAVIALRDNVAVLMTNGEYTHPFPKKGVYFFGSDTGYVSGISFTADATAPEIEWDGQTSVVKKIDPKYLPEGVGGGAQSNQLVIHNEYEQPPPRRI